MAKDKGGQSTTEVVAADHVAPLPSDPAALAAQIERTRDELADTLDALVDKVSPKRVAKRGTSAVTGKVKGAVSSVRSAVSGLGGSPSGKSLSEPGGATGSRTTLALEVGVGAVVALLGLLLLNRRRHG